MSDNYDRIAEIAAEAGELQLPDCNEPPPDFDQCNSPSYGRSFCGFTAKPAEDPSSPCHSHCQEFDPGVVCRDARWFQSICGRSEKALLQKDWGIAHDLDRALEVGEELSRCYHLLLGDPPNHVVETVLVPEDLPNYDCTGDGLPDEFCTGVKVEVYHPANQGMDGFYSHYQGEVLRMFTRSSTAGVPPDRTAWTSDGPTTKSCEEYIWHKYEDYSRFEDAASVLGGNWRAVYDLAYSDVSLATSIGSRGMVGIPMRDWNGVDLPVQVEFPLDRPKNDFFSLPVVSDVQWASFSLAAKQNQLVLDSSDPDEARLLALLQAVQHDPATWRYNESWSWHNGKSETAAASGYLDEQLERVDHLRQRWNEALAARQEAYALFDEATRLVAEEERPEILAPFDPSIWMLEPGIHRTIETMREIKLQSLDELAIWSEPTFDRTFDFDGVVPPVNYVAPPGDLEAAFFAIAAADAHVKTVLFEAEAMGCLEAWEDNLCDWTPKMFAERVLAVVIDDREPAFDRCQKYTGGDFSKLNRSDDYFLFELPNGSFERIYAHDGTGSAACMQQDYRQNPSTVAHYLGCYENRFGALLEAFSLHFTGDTQLFNDAGELEPNYSTGDSTVVGDDQFGVEFSYGSSWAIAGVGSQVACDIEPELSEWVKVKGRAFDYERRLFEAKIDASLYEESSARLWVINTLFYDEDATLVDRSQAPWAFDVIDDDYERDENLLEAPPTVIFIGPFPIEVSAGVAGRVGLAIEVSGHVEAPGCAPSYLRSEVKPYAAVDAFASAGTPDFIVAVGVKAQLTLIAVELPYKLEVGAKAAPVLLVEYDNQLDLKLRMLDGKFKVFAEVDLGLWSERWEKTLFSWNGLRYQKNLIASPARLRVDDLVAYAAYLE